MTSNTIPDAAVEAAAKVYNSKCFDADWGTLPDWARESRREDARGIIEAAAPHMLAGAKFEAWEEGMSYALPGTPRGIETFDALRLANPYRPTT